MCHLQYSHPDVAPLRLHSAVGLAGPSAIPALWHGPEPPFLSIPRSGIHATLTAFPELVPLASSEAEVYSSKRGGSSGPRIASRAVESWGLTRHR